MKVFFEAFVLPFMAMLTVWMLVGPAPAFNRGILPVERFLFAGINVVCSATLCRLIEKGVFGGKQ